MEGPGEGVTAHPALGLQTPAGLMASAGLAMSTQP